MSDGNEKCRNASGALITRAEAVREREAAVELGSVLWNALGSAHLRATTWHARAESHAVQLIGRYVSALVLHPVTDGVHEAPQYEPRDSLLDSEGKIHIDMHLRFTPNDDGIPTAFNGALSTTKAAWCVSR